MAMDVKYTVYDLATNQVLGGGVVTVDEEETALERGNKWAERTFCTHDCHVSTEILRINGQPVGPEVNN